MSKRLEGDLGMKRSGQGAKGWLFKVLGGYELALICMLLLLLLTWLCTLEQVDSGLYWTLRKYFSFESWYVIPELNGKDVPVPLPGGYWVCAIFTVNLIVGGLIRARKGWKHSGVLVSHFAMVFLMISGAVGYHQSSEALSRVREGEVSDYAQRAYVESIEIFEVVDGEVTAPTVINSKLLEGLRGNPENQRKFMMKEFPFDVEVFGYLTSAALVSQKAGMPENKNLIVGGLSLAPLKSDPVEEMNLGGAYVRVISKEGKELQSLVLSEAKRDYMTVTVDDKIYGFRMVREIWVMPFKIKLKKAIGEYYPGTERGDGIGKAKTYESYITVIGEDEESGYDAHIEMNKPLRYRDLTMYQTTWTKAEGGNYSGFTVKSNPSDQWPKYAIYVAGAALGVHFLMRLSMFVGASRRRNRREK